MSNTATNKKVRLYRMSTAEHECPWGIKAVKLLEEQGIEFEDCSDCRGCNRAKK